MHQNKLFCNEWGGMKKVNENIFYLLTRLLGYLPMETEQ